MPRGTIGWAVQALMQGKKVCRAGWNGRGMHLALQTPDEDWELADNEEAQ